MSSQATLSIAGRVDFKPRSRPENIEEHPGDGRECQHCHNTEAMMHILVCEECGVKRQGPPIQDAPRCECGGMRECVRYTYRLAGRDDRGIWQKRTFHPVTGEEMSPEDLREEGFR